MALPFFLPPIQIQEQGATEYMEARQNKDKKHFISMGSYGVIYNNPSNPKEVIKILKPDTNINEEVRKAEKMVQLTGDNRQRIQKIRITKNDVPYNALKKYRNFNSLNSFMKNDIPALVMPHLGVDLMTYLDTKSYIPPELYLTQCYKLLKQTSILYQNGVSHGDLRAENITFDGSEMTIIDFGTFGTFQEVTEIYENGIHKNIVPSWAPPEFLILFDKVNMTKNYAERLVERSPSYLFSITSDLESLIKQTNDKNNEYIMEHNITKNDTIQYLDNFGLGMVLLEVLAVLYPDTNHKKLRATRVLLEKITHFEISKRILPDQALVEMEKIINSTGGRRYTRRRSKTNRTRTSKRQSKRV
jgi:serine/threonine protein kinase